MIKSEIEMLREENLTLKKENEKLNDTVEWMHDMIWQLIRNNKSDVSNRTHNKFVS